MADFLTPEQRSVRMTAIKGRGNKTTEIAMVRLFRKNGIRGWRRHHKIGRSRPDFVFPRLRLVIFVDGCFWHACPLHYLLPESNTSFWASKAKGNRKRDKATTKRLRNAGWTVLRVWEHAFLKPVNLVTRVKKAMLTVTAIREVGDTPTCSSG